MDKNCSGDWKCCAHSAQGTVGVNCNYCGYCDFQLPRDSRGIDFNVDHKETFDFVGEDEVTFKMCDCKDKSSADINYIEGKYKMRFACNKIKGRVDESK